MTAPFAAQAQAWDQLVQAAGAEAAAAAVLAGTPSGQLDVAVVADDAKERARLHDPAVPCWVAAMAGDHAIAMLGMTAFRCWPPSVVVAAAAALPATASLGEITTWLLAHDHDAGWVLLRGTRAVQDAQQSLEV